MDDGDRKAVCWERPEEAAATYATQFGSSYIPAQERAEMLFSRACKGLYP